MCGYRSINFTKSPASGEVALICGCHKLGVAQIRMHVDQRVCPIKAVDLPILACLSSRCSEVTEVGGLQFCESLSDGFHAKFWGIF